MPNTIADNLARLQTARTDIASAITNMGGTVNTGDGFEEFADDIATIPSGGGGWEQLGNCIVIKQGSGIVVGVSSPGISNCIANAVKAVIPTGTQEISNNAFQNCAQLEEIIIPNTVTTIGQISFYGCTSLIQIEIPSSVTSIGPGAFVNCTNLMSITINKPQNSISGAPWGAPNAQVIWTG